MMSACLRTTALLFFVICPLLHAAADIQGRPNESSGQDASEIDSAFSMFTILLANEDVQQSPDQTDHGYIVFKDGAVRDMWIEPALPVPENVTASENTLHLDDQYSDRISFDFFYGKTQTYDISTPTSTSSNTSVARPKIIEFQNKQEEQSGSFTVVHDCQRNPNPSLLRNVTISVVFPVASGLSVLFQFRKTCGGGDHMYIEFGYYENSENEAKEISRVPFTASVNPVIMGPHVMHTKLYLHLFPPARTQEFFRMTVRSSDPGLEVTPKGPIFGGVLTKAESSIIHVFYECKGHGKYQLVANIPINPFNALHGSWVKDCGGGLAGGFNVGSEHGIKDDIVKKGATSRNWELGLHSTSESLSPDVPVVNSSVYAKNLWLSNDGFSLHVAPVVVTVEKPAVLTVIAPESYTRQSMYTTESNGLLPAGEKVKCRLRLICKKKGKSMVVVTFPIKSFTNVEVSFLKECRAPRRYVHSGFLRTANSVMAAVSLCMIFVLAYCGKRQWKRADVSLIDKPAPGYRPV